MKPYELLVDHESCWGCRTCEVACKQEHRTPEGVRLIKVLEEGPGMVDGKAAFRFRVALCLHCDEPDCAAVCPEAAIVKRDDGLVVLNEAKCSGCGLCSDACPYDAVEFDPDTGTAQKCNGCFQRVDSGLIPACADNICPGHCIYFGRPDEIRQKLETQFRGRS